MNIKINLLSIFIIVGLTFSNISEAQFKNPLSALGGDSESSGGDISAIQDKLLSDLTNASDKMKGGEASTEDIQGGLTLSSDTVAAQQEIINQGDSMSAESKALYAKALLPYAKSVAKTAKLSGPIKDFTNEAQNSLKSIRNPMEIRKLKKTLDVGLFVGKNAPKLIVNLGKSSKDLITFAKKNDLDTSAADDIEL